MPLSRSRSVESMTRSATFWFSRNDPDCQSIASTSVVLPWSTCATIATLRRSSRPGIATQGSEGQFANRTGPLRRLQNEAVQKARAAVGSFVFLVVAPGVVAGVVPWLLTGWSPGGAWSARLPLRLVGVILLAAGVIALVHAFVRFI